MTRLLISLGRMGHGRFRHRKGQFPLRGIHDDVIAIMHLPLDDLQGQRIDDLPLEDPLERPCAIHRIIPCLDELVHRGGRQRNGDVALRPAGRARG